MRRSTFFNGGFKPMKLDYLSLYSKSVRAFRRKNKHRCWQSVVIRVLVIPGVFCVAVNREVVGKKVMSLCSV